MVLLIIILSLLLFFSWILFAPVILAVNTETSQYSVRLPLILKVSAIADINQFYLRIRIFFFPFTVHPSGLARKDSHRKKRKKTRRPVSVQYGVLAFRELIKSFRLKLLYLNVDTGDFLMNACMVPGLMQMQTERITVNVNFMEERILIMDLRNQLARLLWIFVKYKYRSIVKP